MHLHTVVIARPLVTGSVHRPFPPVLSQGGASVVFGNHRCAVSHLRDTVHGDSRTGWTHWDSNPGHPPCKGGTLPLSYEPASVEDSTELRVSLGSSKVPDRTTGPSGIALTEINVGPQMSMNGESGPKARSRSVGGDPAADSPTATLLRLKPPCEAQIRPQ